MHASQNEGSSRTHVLIHARGLFRLARQTSTHCETKSAAECSRVRHLHAPRHNLKTALLWSSATTSKRSYDRVAPRRLLRVTIPRRRGKGEGGRGKGGRGDGGRGTGEASRSSPSVGHDTTPQKTPLATPCVRTCVLSFMERRKRPRFVLPGIVGSLTFLPSSLPLSHTSRNQKKKPAHGSSDVSCCLKTFYTYGKHIRNVYLGRRFAHARVSVVVHERHQSLAKIGVHGWEQGLLLR